MKFDRGSCLMSTLSHDDSTMFEVGLSMLDETTTFDVLLSTFNNLLSMFDKTTTFDLLLSTFDDVKWPTHRNRATLRSVKLLRERNTIFLRAVMFVANSYSLFRVFEFSCRQNVEEFAKLCFTCECNARSGWLNVWCTVLDSFFLSFFLPSFQLF